jgi:hypothetical protein
MEGNLRKMKVSCNTNSIDYSLKLGDASILMNEQIGKNIKISFDGKINCVVCGRLIKKVVGQGFCYPCFTKSAENSDCIIRPELCRGHLGEGRDPAWEQENHVQPHVVYLANSSGLKVGVTRSSQILTRWIDQGASSAIILAETENRYLAGTIEVALKEHFADKTDWRKMLKNETLFIDLVKEKEEAEFLLPIHLSGYFSNNNTLYNLNFPVLKYPSKITSMGLEKNPVVEGVFNGIKGQYLYIGDSGVINIRNHSGYFVNIEFN